MLDGCSRRTWRPAPDSGGYSSAVRWARRLAVCGVIVVTSAGACQQDWDGPLPAPEEIGAAPFPVDAVVGGLDAVYATLVDTTRLREGGRDVVRQCYSLLRLRPDGVAETSDACTEDGDIGEPAVAADTWIRTTFVGDYARLGGELTVRMVDWDFISEEFELVEFSVEYCRDGFYGRTSAGDRGVTTQLVVGDPPPDAPRCDVSE